MNSIEDFKSLFTRPTPVEVASRELADAELERLKAQTAKEYAASVVAYNDERIKRLRKFINEMTKESNNG